MKKHIEKFENFVNEEIGFIPSFRKNRTYEDTEKTLENILRDYEVYNPKEFIKYLHEKGYKIIKI